MKISEKPGKIAPIYFYEDVEPKYLEFKPQIRVLPAPFWNEKKLVFRLLNRYEPGENKYFPEGGFEVRGPDGERRSYFLDQVIIHPIVFQEEKQLEKARKEREKRLSKHEKDQKRAKKQATKIKDPNAPKSTRGRKPLTDEQRAERDKQKQQELEKKLEINPERKRGRRADPEKQAARALAKAKALELNPERKRGRPKKQ